VPNWKAKSASGDASHTFQLMFSTELSAKCFHKRHDNVGNERIVKQ
jgi:hypothetical protein